MSKPIKSIMMRDYASRVGADTKDAMLISIRGLKAVDNNKVRNQLAKKRITVTVVRNSLARKAFEKGELAPLTELMSGASALAYGGESVIEVAREIVALMAKFPTIELKGAILDGQLFKGKAGVEELSRFPTKDEAIARVVTLVVSPGRNVLGQIKGPGSALAGIVKAIEGKLEKGEAIAKAG